VTARQHAGMRDRCETARSPVVASQETKRATVADDSTLHLVATRSCVARKSTAEPAMEGRMTGCEASGNVAER